MPRVLELWTPCGQCICPEAGQARLDENECTVLDGQVELPQNASQGCIEAITGCQQCTVAARQQHVLQPGPYTSAFHRFIRDLMFSYARN